jgi:hypothetical protein
MGTLDDLVRDLCGAHPLLEGLVFGAPLAHVEAREGAPLHAPMVQGREPGGVGGR